jgi:hypothetical protein
MKRSFRHSSLYQYGTVDGNPRTECHWANSLLVPRGPELSSDLGAHLVHTLVDATGRPLQSLMSRARHYSFESPSQHWSYPESAGTTPPVDG